MEPTAATLTMLADARATGALVVPGPQRGTVFLVEGRVTYVEADDVPGLDARCARRARSDGRPEPIGAVTRSATVDAAVATLARPATAPARFHAGVTHPSGEVAPLGVDALFSAVAAGVDALSRAAVGPDDELTLRPAGAGGVRLVGRQLAVLAGFTEGATPRELAWRAGEAILDTVAAVGDLVAQGVCAVATTRPRPLPPGGAPGLPAATRSSSARAPAAPPASPTGRAGGSRVTADAAPPAALGARTATAPGGPTPPPPSPSAEPAARIGGPLTPPGGSDEVVLGPRQRPTPSHRAASRRVVPKDIPGDAPPDAARAVTGPLAPLARAIEARASDDAARGSGRTRRRPGGSPSPTAPAPTARASAAESAPDASGSGHGVATSGAGRWGSGSGVGASGSGGSGSRFDGTGLSAAGANVRSSEAGLSAGGPGTGSDVAGSRPGGSTSGGPGSGGGEAAAGFGGSTSGGPGSGAGEAAPAFGGAARDAGPAADDLPQRSPRPVPPQRRAKGGWPAAFARPDHDVYVRLLDGLRRR